MVVGYNSSELRAEDQIVGSLLIVVLPGVAVAFVFAWLTAMVARATSGRRSAEPVSS